MRASRWKHVLAIPCALVLVALLALGAAVGTRYAEYCQRYGFVRFNVALFHSVRGVR